MRGWAPRAARILMAIVLAGALQTASAPPAQAQAPAQPQAAPAPTPVRSIRTQGQFVKYDAEAGSVTVRVTSPGSGPDAQRLQVGKIARFLVQSQGSVLTRTLIAIQGVKAGLGDIEKDRTVNVYWRPDLADPKVRIARKIDVVLSAQELDARFGNE